MRNYMSYCCKDIELFLEDPRDPINYDPLFREYYIKLYRQYNIITMVFCPWCGKKFPESLREKFFDTLESDYNIITDIGEYKTRPDIPSEFQSDEWWKKRGL